MSDCPSIMVVAGEVSGDMHAAAVVRHLRTRVPDLTVFGIGGDELEALGAEIRYHARDMAVMGFTEVVKRYGFFRCVFRETLEEAVRRRPDVVLLVDYPGFNLRLAEKLHAEDIRVVYYVCPQVWAWHRSRIPKMAETIDRLITIFPFERQCFEGTGLRVDFAGHPLVDEALAERERDPVELPWTGTPRVAMLPGSRPHEIHRILPVMWAAAQRLESDYPAASFVVAATSDAQSKLVRQTLESLGDGPARWEIVAGETRQVLLQADGAMVASGTATIETALMGCPMVIAYKVAAMTYWLGKMLIRVPYIGMVNLVADRLLCPEFVQHDATPKAVASAMSPLLRDGSEREDVLAGLADVRHRLGEGDAANRAASFVLEEMNLSAS